MCYDVRYDFRIKTMFSLSFPPIIVRGLMSYLWYLCLFAYSGVQHILCCIFVLFSLSCVPYVFSFSGLAIFDCPAVFSSVYLPVFFSVYLPVFSSVYLPVFFSVYLPVHIL